MLFPQLSAKTDNEERRFGKRGEIVKILRHISTADGSLSSTLSIQTEPHEVEWTDMFFKQKASLDSSIL